MKRCIARVGLLLALAPYGFSASTPAPGEGQLAWPGPVNVQGYITWSSPAISQDDKTVYVGVQRDSSGRVVAITSEGASKWGRDGRQLSGLVDSSPSIGPDGTIYVGCVNLHLYALNPDDGSTKWAFNAGGWVSSSPAISADGAVVYVGSSSRHLYALNSRSGTKLWDFKTDGIVDSSPSVAVDGTIYVGSNDRHLYAINPDGTLKWRYLTGGAILASPAIAADGTVYIGSMDQKMYAFLPDGHLKWSYLTNGAIESSPTIGADGTVYVASWDRHLYAFDPTGPDDSPVKWKKELGSGTRSTAAIRADGVIILGTDDGKIWAIEADGATRWIYDTKTRDGDYIESSPIVALDGSIYIGSSNGYFYKLKGNGSPLSEYSSWPAFRGNSRRTAQARARLRGRLLNLSARAEVGPGANLIAGFVLDGVGQQPLLVRGIGPTLQRFAVSNYMPDPMIALYTGAHALFENDDWEVRRPGYGLADAAAAVGAFELPPQSKDAAIVEWLVPGLYSTHVSSSDRRGGIVLTEIYDAGVNIESTSGLTNLSLRGQVGTGDAVLIAGFVVEGPHVSRLLIRGIGPGLAQFGVSEPVARPRLTLYRGTTALATNAGWTSDGRYYDLETAARIAGAFPLATSNADAALIATVEPGAYTLHISSTTGATGEAMAEIYIVP